MRTAVGLHVSSPCKLKRKLSERWARGSESGWFFSRPRDYYREHAKEVEREGESAMDLGFVVVTVPFA